MIQNLSEMLRNTDPAICRQGVTLAESLSRQPLLHPMIRQAQEGPGSFLTGVNAALMLRLPERALAQTERDLLLALPFNLPDLSLMGEHEHQGGVHIVETISSDELPPLRFPPGLTSLSLYYLKSRPLLDAILEADLPSLTELNLDQAADGVDLTTLSQLYAVRTLCVRSSPGVELRALPSALTSLVLERCALSEDVLAEASTLTTVSMTDCTLAGELQLPMPGRIQEVHLVGMGLTSMPDGLLFQPDLAVLSMKRNSLTALPDSVWAMAGLEALHLSDNQLTALPQTIGQITALRQLDLSENQLTALPETIAGLLQLEVLLLSDNPLTTLPDEMADLHALKTLSLGHTGLTTVPECLHALPALEELDVRGMPLQPLPPLTAFPALRRIRVDRALDGAVLQWARQRVEQGMIELLVK